MNDSWRKVMIHSANAERRARSITEACEELGVSRNFLMSQIRQGLLRARRFGRRVIILNEDFETYLDSAESVSAGHENTP